MALTRRSLILGAGAVTLAGAAAGYLFLRPDAGDGTAYFSENGVALRGADPVAYFTEGKSVIGTADHALSWSGSTWHFASAENRDLFRADPAAYAPQFGGYCAWAVAAKGQLASIQPANWTIVDGKLYLNFNDDIQTRWDADRDGFIAEGHRRWPGVKQLIDAG